MRVSTRVAALSLLALPSFAADEADSLYLGPVVAESTSSYATGTLDGPKLDPVTANLSSYDWYVCLLPSPISSAFANMTY
jgi:hypothetical protein